MRRYLLDTHAFIWLDEASSCIPDRAMRLLADEANAIQISIATPWEMAIKMGLGKLALGRPLGQMLEHHARRNGASVLLPSSLHFERLITLPRHHGDPFDRLIAAQALAEGIPLITADTVFARYGVERVWD